MNRATRQRCLCGAALAAALGTVASCAVPLAPGYRIENQSVTVRFVSGANPYLALHAAYRLKNIGNAPLTSIQVALPGRSSFGRRNLRALVDAHRVTPRLDRAEKPEEGESAISETWPTIWTIAFTPAWRRKQIRQLVLEYDLTPSEGSDPRISVGATGFYLNDSGWFPDPLTPKALFAKDVVRPDFSELHIDVPATFLAAASGALHSANTRGAETDDLFVLRRYSKASFLAKTDFDPFVAAGEYHEQQIETSGGDVNFWMFQPFEEAQLAAVASQLTAMRNYLTSTFGSLPRVQGPVFVVQFPLVTPGAAGPAYDRLPVLPGMVFVTPRELSEAIRSRRGLEHLKKRLALTWFDHLITPRPEAWLLGDALATYALALESEKSPSPQSRIEAIRGLLESYHQAGPGAAEKPVAFVTPADPAGQRQMAAAKLSLFIYALEDRCGPQGVLQAVEHLTYALRGNEYGYSDFRAALEEASHQHVADLFSAWLDGKGIPKNFLAKYAAPTTK